MVRAARWIGISVLLGVLFSLTAAEDPARDGEKKDDPMRRDRERIEKEIANLPEGWSHLAGRGKPFVVFTDASRSLAVEIARQFESMRDLFCKTFPGEPRIETTIIVRLFREKDAFRRTGAPAGTLGFWSDETRELSLHLDPKLGKKSLLAALKHEAFHQFVRCRTGCRPAPWFDEGHADYFAAAEFLGAQMKIRENPWCREKIRTIVLRKEFVPLREFFSLTTEQYRERKEVCHPQGWSIIHFLRQGKRLGAHVKREWAKIPDLYLKQFDAAVREIEKSRKQTSAGGGSDGDALSRKASVAALDRTFDGWTDDDWAALEKAWLDFCR